MGNLEDLEKELEEAKADHLRGVDDGYCAAERSWDVCADWFRQKIFSLLVDRIAGE
jgi:hypothetical protein